MTTNVLVLGAGFGGLELTSVLSEELGTDVNVTLVDRAEAFVFGFAKFDVLFGWKTLEQVRAYYRDILKPGVTFRREVVTAIDPVARRVTTDGGSYEADYLVVGLGAEYDFAATPGMVEGGYDFYSLEGVARLKEALPTITSGHVVISVLGEPFKCPPAPCEAAMLLDRYFAERGVRENIQISVISPWGRPIPPSPNGSKAILDRFAERNIAFVADSMVTAIDPKTRTAELRDGGSLAYEMFIGIPKHRVPDVVAESGMTENGWIPVDRATLATRFPNVYAVGDVTSVGTPKAGVFAENAARVVGAEILARIRGSSAPEGFGGTGTCYVEFGDESVGRIDADFFGGPHPVAPMTGPDMATAEEKKQFSMSRRERWFGYK